MEQTPRLAIRITKSENRVLSCHAAMNEIIRKEQMGKSGTGTPSLVAFLSG